MSSSATAAAVVAVSGDVGPTGLVQPGEVKALGWPNRKPPSTYGEVSKEVELGLVVHWPQRFRLDKKHFLFEDGQAMGLLPEKLWLPSLEVCKALLNKALDNGPCSSPWFWQEFGLVTSWWPLQPELSYDSTIANTDFQMSYFAFRWMFPLLEA